MGWVLFSFAYLLLIAYIIVLIRKRRKIYVTRAKEYGDPVKRFRWYSGHLYTRVYHITGVPSAEKGYLTLKKGSKNGTIRIGNNEYAIKRCEWGEQAKRSVGGAVAGAIAGDLLGGIPGMIGGALVGGRRKNNSLSILTATMGNSEILFYFRTTAKEHSRLSSLLH